MEQTMELVTGLRAASYRVIRVGDGFSGCELAWKILEALMGFYKEHFSITLQMKHEFCCELNEEKAQWLMLQFPHIPCVCSQCCGTL